MIFTWINKSKSMSNWARGFEKNQQQGRQEYPQTWYYMYGSWRDPVRKLLQALCSMIGGHELSKTEWSYGGGVTNRQCRRCDKTIRVPKENVNEDFKESKYIMGVLNDN